MQEAADLSLFKIILSAIAAGWLGLLSFVLGGFALDVRSIRKDIKEIHDKFVPEKNCNANTERLCKVFETTTAELSRATDKIDQFKDHMVGAVDTKVGEIYEHIGKEKKELNRRIDNALKGGKN